MANRAHDPTPEQRRTVRAMASYGVALEDMGHVLKISKNTLLKYYREEIDRGLPEANAMVAQRLYNTAVKGEGKLALIAQMFWLKTRAKWRETQTHEHSGPDGKPIATQEAHIWITPAEADL